MRHRFAVGEVKVRKQVPEGHRSLTLRVVLRPTDTTLTAELIGVVRAQTLDILAQEVGARLR